MNLHWLLFLSLLIATFCISSSVSVPLPFVPSNFTAHLQIFTHYDNATIEEWTYVDDSLNASATVEYGVKFVNLANTGNRFKVQFSTGKCESLCRNGKSCNGSPVCPVERRHYFTPLHYPDAVKYAGTCQPNNKGTKWIVVDSRFTYYYTSFCFDGNTPMWVQLGEAEAYLKLVFVEFKPSVDRSIFIQPDNCTCRPK
eukprot:TRINITY_DN8171_c0_g1_i1.p1 TRINITY_DN8171_c0_g1~~TRINITY_DN8171_c0_g1_i1.p1  ORF type:complete len:198 (-),score=21.63 TRINITY_DN8171_c0_g1_i1:63-656(-)